MVTVASRCDVDVTLPAPLLPPPRPQLAQRYVIRRELARGGMGKISVAEDLLLRRTVALKELLVDNVGLAVRFQRELDLTARLQHPSIVCIHDGGVWANGKPFYVMKLVNGEPPAHRTIRCRSVRIICSV